MVTLATMYFYTTLYGLLWVNFELGWLKLSFFYNTGIDKSAHVKVILITFK